MTTPDGSMTSAESSDANLRNSEESLLASLLEELTEAMRQGQQPDVEGVANRYPALSADLRSLWATIWVAEEMARNGSREAEPGAVRDGALETIAWPPATEPGTASVSLSPHPGLTSSVLVRFGEYELFEELGRGGMGVVSRAREIARERIVALKRLLRGPESTPQDLERFRIEALAAARLAHPHIVPVFHVGECDGQPYFTMQYIEGTTLARKLADGPLPAQDAARLLVPVCRAIHYAHDCSVLHRDLKPSNILIDREGNPYVSDFGLAKRIDVDSMFTPSGAFLGTPSYMAPEQAGSSNSGRREPLGPRADVYSLGAILYHMLTGRPPFQAATPIETMLLALEHDPVAPRALNPQVNPDLEMVALKCLQKPPSLRYASAAALAEDLESYLRGDPVSARSTSLRALAARLMGETHHAPVLENWGLLWIFHSIALLVFFGATNWLYLSGVGARWPYVLIFTVGLCGWAALFWALRRRGGPIRFVERQLAHVWGAGIVSINLIFLVEWLLDLPVLKLAPMIAVTNGMLFMIKAGILSGDYYPQAALTFLAVFPMAMFPRFAPLIFGVVASACFFVTGLKYRLRRLRST
jgi:eukaryotic-like serine/threonine-protein kinase